MTHFEISADEIIVGMLREACAEIDRLRAELATMHRSVVHECCVDKQEAETAIARVRELCAAHAGDGAVLRASVLEAIEGGRA